MPIIFRDLLVVGAAGEETSYPSSAMAFLTRSRVSLLIEGLSLHTRETVEVDTPARAATSLMVTAMVVPSFVKIVQMILGSFAINVAETNLQVK